MKSNQVVYSHKEVAMKYFPHLSPKSASEQLTRWILRDPVLLDEMQQAGYVRGQRLFTPLQLSILLYDLGNPTPIDWEKDPQKPVRNNRSAEK